MRRPRQVALVVALSWLAALAACASDSMSPEDVAGLYELILVDSASLPAVTDSTAQAVTRVDSGAISIDPDGFYTMAIVTQTTPAGGDPDPGLFSEEGTLRFTDEGVFRLETDSTAWTGIVELSGNLRIAVLMLIASDEALELTFHRQ
jgi:hypothetical protein